METGDIEFVVAFFFKYCATCTQFYTLLCVWQNNKKVIRFTLNAKKITINFLFILFC